MLLPIIAIFICNSLIVLKTKTDDIRRSTFKQKTTFESKICKQKRRDAVKLELEILVSSRRHVQNKVLYRKNYSKKMTKTLILVSFSYALLSLPYLVAWSGFFVSMTLVEIESYHKNDLFSLVQITEIFFILNYSIHFYISCLSGSLFRNQLKMSTRIKRFVK